MPDFLKRLRPERTENGTDWQVVDMHCHILPGLDDGARDISEAISMLRIASSEGISDMIVTPHFHVGRHTASPQTVMDALEKVREAAARERITIRLYPGNEIYYFDDIVPHLQRRQICTMNESRHVLVEFSPMIMLQSMQNALDCLLNEGYQPILAHAERYKCLLTSLDDALFLHKMGVQIQINASTVTDKTGGAEGKRFAHRMLKERAVDYIGTDAHGSHHRTPEIARCREIVARKYGADCAYWLMCGNAGRLLGSSVTER